MFENELMLQYNRLYTETNTPKTYFKLKESGATIPPTIPFVGANYFSAPKKILVYGSAENLTYLNDGKGHNINEWMDKNDLSLVMNRHRAFFHRENARNTFFKNIHLRPADDGSLLIAARKIIEMFGLTVPDVPADFLETICIANFGKFSIQTESRNIDGAGSSSYLNDSLPYVKIDVQILKPDLIILPSSIFKRVRSKLILEAQNANQNVQFAKIMQTNARVINCHLKKKTSGDYKLSNWESDWLHHCQHLNMVVYLEWIHKNWHSIIESN
jgi:hypothetical protein